LQSQKNSQKYYIRTRDKSGSNSPPLKGNVQIPPFQGTCRHNAQSNARGMSGGWMFKLQFDRHITANNWKPLKAGKTQITLNISKVQL